MQRFCIGFCGTLFFFLLTAGLCLAGPLGIFGRGQSSGSCANGSCSVAAEMAPMPVAFVAPVAKESPQKAAATQTSAPLVKTSAPVEAAPVQRRQGLLSRIFHRRSR